MAWLAFNANAAAGHTYLLLNLFFKITRSHIFPLLGVLRFRGLLRIKSLINFYLHYFIKKSINF